MRFHFDNCIIFKQIVLKTRYYTYISKERKGRNAPLSSWQFGGKSMLAIDSRVDVRTRERDYHIGIPLMNFISMQDAQILH